MISNYAYWYFEKAIPDKICDEIVKRGLSESPHLAKVESAELSEMNKTIKKKLLKVRNSDVVWLSEPWIAGMVSGFVNKANENAGWNFQHHVSEPAQFTIYNKNQHYDWHQDISHLTEEKNQPPNTQRKLSVSVQLTDPKKYTGGDLVFSITTGKNKNKILKEPKLASKGTVVIFPSYVFHKVNPVTKGTRYSLVMWFRGDRFK